MRIIIITGQTATGKTSLALELAEKHQGELINCDSRQVYKYLDIITGKDKKILKDTKIWMYDVVKPDQYFSSFDYAQQVIPIIKNILKQGKTPIIIGGSYMYLKHVLYTVETENIPPNFKLREQLKNKTTADLQKMIISKYQDHYDSLNNSEKNNRQRLIRKLEILEKNMIHGFIDKSYPEKQNKFKITLPEKLGIKNVNCELIGLKYKNKDNLRLTIKKRVEKRLKQGAVNEVVELLKMGYKETDPGLKTIGYPQLLTHLKGGLAIDTAKQIWINKEVQYAKRQYTFMKKDDNIQWREI